MSQTLTEIAQKLKDNSENKDKKVQLIYAFNGTGKTRLSREFKNLIAPKNTDNEEDAEKPRSKILYYNAFTEDLFYWDNDLEKDAEPKLKIQPNSFTDWLIRMLKDEGQDQNIITRFQRYADEKLTPKFNDDFSEITFSFARGDDTTQKYIKISKSEERCLIWSIFYSLLEWIIDVLNEEKEDERGTDEFNNLEYIFIDDPVSSLDENHLIMLAVDLAQLIKSSKSKLKFIITTHNPLFFNVLHNEFRNPSKKKKKYLKFILNKYENNSYELKDQNDSPFSYHIHLKEEIEKAIESNSIQKYHFNFLRNILEKTATFLGQEHWSKLLPPNPNHDDKPNPYEVRITNIYSHSSHSGEEISELTEQEKTTVKDLLDHLIREYKFAQNKDKIQ